MNSKTENEEDSQAMMNAALGIGPRTGKRSWEYILEPIDENDDDKEKPCL